MKKPQVGLLLRRIQASDVDHVMTWVNDPEVVKNFQHFDRVFTRQDEVTFIEKILADKNCATFSIFRKSDGKYIGQCAINQISWENRLGRMAMIIKREYWGHGYAQRAMQLLFRYAFGRLGLNKVWGMVYASNVKGMHIYEKMGFQREGLLRKEYFWRGRFHDIIRIGILKKDFIRMNARKKKV